MVSVRLMPAIEVLKGARMSEHSEDYWTRKEKYNKMVEDSALCWHKLYTEEKVKREALEIENKELTILVDKMDKGMNEGTKFLLNYARDWDRS